MLKILLIIIVCIFALPSLICWLIWYFTEKKNHKLQSKLTDAQMQELLSDEGLTTKEVEGAIPAQSAQKEKLNTTEKTVPHESQTIVLKRDIYYQNKILSSFADFIQAVNLSVKASGKKELEKSSVKRRQLIHKIFRRQ